MKRWLIFSCIFLVSIIIFSVSVSAQWYGDLGGAANQVIDWIQQIFTPFFMALFGSSEYLFEKILFLFLLYVVILLVLKRTPLFEDKVGIAIIVSIIVSVLATRFLTEAQWVQAVLTPYGVLGIALLSFIPFFIFFYFIEKGIESSIARRIAWCFYAAVFIGIFWSRYTKIGKPAWIFLGAAILALIVMLFDNTIQGHFVRSAIKEGLNIDRIREITRLQKKIDDDMGLLAHATGDQRRRLLKAIAENTKTVKKLSKRPYG